MGDRFCPSCGRPTADCPGCARALDPPHYCAECGVRMAVQVTPTGWRALCREHGTLDQT